MAREYTMGARIQLKDLYSGTLKDIVRATDTLSDSTSKVKKATDTYRDSQGRLRDSQGKYITDTSRARKVTDDLGKSMDFLKDKAKGISTLLNNITPAHLALAAATAGIGFAFKASLDKAIAFEAQLSSIKALTGASAAEMTQMQTLALKMGANTKYSALEAAKGIEELLKAGITPAQVQAGGLQAALNLATAGGMELADSAELMSTSLNAFKKDALTADQAANMLAGTANASATSLQEMKYGLSAVSAVSAGMGMSLKDTTAALGVFANFGLKGSDAGTSFKTFLSNLQPTTKAQTTAFQQLGLSTAKVGGSFYDSTGKLKSLADIAEVLHTSMAKLTDQQRSLYLEQIFGSDAIRAGNILFEAGGKGVRDFYNEMGKVTALSVAKEKMDNAAGAIEQFKGAMETLQIVGLSPFLPFIKDGALAASDWVEAHTEGIKQRIESMISTTRSYLYTHFLGNPEFQQLTTFDSKIKFVFGDLKKTFDEFMANGGSQALQDGANRAVQILAGALEASVPVFIDIGVKIAAGVLKGLAKGFFTYSWADPTDGSPNKVLGDLSHQLNSPSFKKQLEDNWNMVNGKSVPDMNYTTPDAADENSMRRALRPKPYADGGIVTRPHLGIVGEAGAEAYIPLSSGKRDRSLELWAQTGAALGVTGATPRSAGNSVVNHIQLSPTIVLQDAGTRNTKDMVVEFLDHLVDLLKDADLRIAGTGKGALL